MRDLETDHVFYVSFSVDDSLVVDGLETSGNLHRNVAGTRRSHATFGQLIGQGSTGEELHFQEGTTVIEYPEVSDVDGVRMPNLGCEPCLGQKSLLRDFVLGFEQNFDRDRCIQREVSGFVDHPHTALTEPLLDLVFLIEDCPDDVDGF